MNTTTTTTKESGSGIGIWDGHKFISNEPTGTDPLKI